MSLPAPAKAHFGLIYKNGNCTIPQRKRMIQIRYNVEISDSGIKGKTPVPWGQPQLDALYEVLGVFPDGSVITNSDIDELHLVVSGIGTYYPAYDAIHLPGSVSYNMATATWGNTVVPENHFLGTIRHEMGHAIDEQIGGEKWYTTDPNIDWDTWSSVGGLARLDGGARRLGTGQRRRRARPDPQVRQVALLRRERQRPARGAGGPQPRVQQVPGVPDRRHGDAQRARGRAQQLPGDAGHRGPRLHPPAHLQEEFYSYAASARVAPTPRQELAIAMVHSDNRLASIMAMGIFATGIAASTLLILAHDRPFTGDISIKPDPLLQVMPAIAGSR